LDNLYNVDKHKQELIPELAQAYNDIENNNYQAKPIKLTLKPKSILLAQSKWEIKETSTNLKPVYFLVNGSAGGVKDGLGGPPEPLNGELIIKIGDGGGFEDGDIIHAFNSKKILSVHAQHITHPKKAPKNGDGLRVPDSLLEVYLENTKEYRFERISQREIRKINLVTGEQDIFSDVSNSNGEYIDVPLFIERRLRNDNHMIFGTKGNEYWYGGNTITTDEKIDKVWKEIEKRTEHKKSDHTSFPFTDNELSNHYAIKIDDFTDNEANEFTAPELGEVDEKGDKPVLKQRKHKVDYKNLPGLSEKDKQDISNKNIKKDHRKNKSFKKADIVKLK